MSEPTQEQYQHILSSAIQAPSADNHHQFRFEIANQALRLWYPGILMPPGGGYKRALLLLSLGAVSENITLAAGKWGLGGSCTLFPDPARTDLAVEVRWTHDDSLLDPLHEAIPDRHTNRRLFFHGPGLGEGELDGLRQAAEHLPGCSLLWLDRPELRRESLRLIRLAEIERFRNPALHKELFSAIRFDVGWTESCADGLPPGALEIEKPLRPVFRLMRHWPVMRAFNLLGAHHMMGLRAAWLPCRLAPHVGLIAAEGWSDSGVFAAGRAFQRVWLAATALGMSLQPLPASAIYAMPSASSENVPKNLQPTLAEAWRSILPDRIPVMLFRMGRAKLPKLSTSRHDFVRYLR